MEFWADEETISIFPKDLEENLEHGFNQPQNLFFGAEIPGSGESSGYWEINTDGMGETSVTFFSYITKMITPAPIFRFFQVLFYGSYLNGQNQQIIVNPHNLSSIRYMFIIAITGFFLLIMSICILRRKMDKKVTYASQITKGFKNMMEYRKKQKQKI